MKNTCDKCAFWDKGGKQGAPESRHKEIKQGLGKSKLEQMFAHHCKFMPQVQWKYEDDWCGQFQLSENEKLRQAGQRILNDKI